MARPPARLWASNKIPFVWTNGRRIGLRMPGVMQSIRRPIFSATADEGFGRQRYCQAINAVRKAIAPEVT